jgi:hypothetical protein
MQYVHKQHTKSSQDIFKEEDIFNFNVKKRNQDPANTSMNTTKGGKSQIISKGYTQVS